MRTTTLLCPTAVSVARVAPRAPVAVRVDLNAAAQGFTMAVPL